jgi:hypothetical protein
MQREDAAHGPNGRTRRQIDRHAITLVGHLLVTGVWLERRLTTSLRVSGRPERRTQRPPDPRQIQRNSTSSPTGNEEL